MLNESNKALFIADKSLTGLPEALQQYCKNEQHPDRCLSYQVMILPDMKYKPDEFIKEIETLFTDKEIDTVCITTPLLPNEYSKWLYNQVITRLPNSLEVVLFLSVSPSYFNFNLPTLTLLPASCLLGERLTSGKFRRALINASVNTHSITVNDILYRFRKGEYYHLLQYPDLSLATTDFEKTYLSILIDKSMISPTLGDLIIKQLKSGVFIEGDYNSIALIDPPNDTVVTFNDCVITEWGGLISIVFFK